MRINCNCCNATHKADAHLIYSADSQAGYHIVAVAHCPSLERKVIAYHSFTDFDKLGPRRFLSKPKDVMAMLSQLANKAQYIKPLTRLDDGLRDTRAKAIVGEATLLMSKDPAEVSKRIIRMFA